MRLVTTSLGYKFETDQPDLEVGQQIEVPIPEVEETTLASDRVLSFFAQMYGLQKEWSKPSLGRFKAPDGLKHFPEQILTLREDRLKIFLVRMYSAGASMINHKSSTSRDQAEVRFGCVHESLARELQYLWWRRGVKTRVVWHGQMKRWLVQTSGAGAYVQMREYIKSTRNPRLTRKLKELDMLVPIKFKLDEYPMKDRIVEIEDV